MSGLGLIWQRQGGTVDPTALERMAEALRRDGPDGRYLVPEGALGFVCTQRIVTPQDRALVQPVRADAGRWALLFDGRLDHRDGLCRALNITGPEAAQLPDAALAIRAWSRWGADGLERWYGDFACIIWDRDQRQLTLLRDPFGRRPLHYHADAGRVVASSMPRGIHAVPGIARSIDIDAITDRAAAMYLHRWQTCFTGIRSVEPGEIVAFGTETSQSTNYYDLRRRIRPVRYASDDDYVDALKEKMQRAIASVTRSDGDIAVAMSGGLDSTSVAVLTSATLPGSQSRLPVYTSVPDPDWDGLHEAHVFADERHYAAAVADHCPVLKLELIDAAGRGIFDVIDRVHAAMEAPQRNIVNMIWADMLFGRARSQGARTILDGGMGNAGFSYSGAEAAAQLFRAFAIRAGARQIWDEAGHRPVAAARSAARLAMRELGGAVPSSLRTRLLRHRGAALMPMEAAALNPRFLAERNVVRRAVAALAPDMDLMTGRTRDQWLVSLKYHHFPSSGAAQFGWSALHDLDLRDPLADRDLLEWCFGVPDSQFRRGREHRWLARRAMQGTLPDAVLNKPVEIGRQSADWHLRLTRDLSRIRDEVDRFARDPLLAELFDFARLRRHLADWPKQTPVSPSDPGFVLQREIPMVLSIGRFVLDNPMS